MRYHSAELIISAASKHQWPDTGLNEIVFAGRSNAGKSSLINALLNRKNLAYSSKTPGRTQLLNFYLVDQAVVFCDTPGYGYAAGSKSQAVDFAKTIDPYFNERSELKGMVLVLDIRRVPNEDDLLMIEYAKSRHLAVIVACTKADKLSRSKQLESIRKIAKELDVNPSSVIACSSVSKTGYEEIWQKMDDILAGK